jgi:hypothetical protein
LDFQQPAAAQCSIPRTPHTMSMDHLATHMRPPAKEEELICWCFLILSAAGRPLALNASLWSERTLFIYNPLPLNSHELFTKLDAISARVNRAIKAFSTHQHQKIQIISFKVRKFVYNILSLAKGWEILAISFCLLCLDLASDK